MLQKLLRLARKDQPKQGDPEEQEEKISESRLRIVHIGGVVETYYMAIPASIILEKYPACVLVKPDVFRRPSDSVVRPEKILRPGQKFLLVPRGTIMKLRRRIRKPSSKDISVSFVSHVSHNGIRDVDGASASNSFYQQSELSFSSGSFSSSTFKKRQGVKKHVRFAGVEVKHKSFGHRNMQRTRKESFRKESNRKHNEGRSSSRQIVAWQPSLKAIHEGQGE